MLGVHAIEQSAHFDCKNKINQRKIFKIYKLFFE